MEGVGEVRGRGTTKKLVACPFVSTRVLCCCCRYSCRCREVSMSKHMPPPWFLHGLILLLLNGRPVQWVHVQQGGNDDEVLQPKRTMPPAIDHAYIPPARFKSRRIACRTGWMCWSPRAALLASHPSSNVKGRKLASAGGCNPVPNLTGQRQRKKRALGHLMRFRACALQGTLLKTRPATLHKLSPLIQTLRNPISSGQLWAMQGQPPSIANSNNSAHLWFSAKPSLGRF
ncbi:MAG: hypothetical protein J3Q66DRAFT_91116 [Benniella sp.]|nr:MAG: hypothetical protein J3Q66DRAFT_91116 [Benniella sp.]